MKVYRSSQLEWQTGDPKTFTGDVRSRVLADAEGPPPVRSFRVEFESGARTHWHAHSGPQWLYVIEGRCRLHKWGEPPQDLDAGDCATIAPGEKHWHGTAPGAARTSHIAVNISAMTSWMEPVTEAQYRGEG